MLFCFDLFCFVFQLEIAPKLFPPKVATRPFPDFPLKKQVLAKKIGGKRTNRIEWILLFWFFFVLFFLQIAH